MSISPGLGRAFDQPWGERIRTSSRITTRSYGCGEGLDQACRDPALAIQAVGSKPDAVHSKRRRALGATRVVDAHSSRASAVRCRRWIPGFFIFSKLDPWPEASPAQKGMIQWHACGLWHGCGNGHDGILPSARVWLSRQRASCRTSHPANGHSRRVPSWRQLEEFGFQPILSGVIRLCGEAIAVELRDCGRESDLAGTEGGWFARWLEICKAELDPARCRV